MQSRSSKMRPAAPKKQPPKPKTPFDYLHFGGTTTFVPEPNDAICGAAPDPTTGRQPGYTRERADFVQSGRRRCPECFARLHQPRADAILAPWSPGRVAADSACASGRSFMLPGRPGLFMVLSVVPGREEHNVLVWASKTQDRLWQCVAVGCRFVARAATRPASCPSCKKPDGMSSTVSDADARLAADRIFWSAASKAGAFSATKLKGAVRIGDADVRVLAVDDADSHGVWVWARPWTAPTRDEYTAMSGSERVGVDASMRALNLDFSAPVPTGVGSGAIYVLWLGRIQTNAEADAKAGKPVKMLARSAKGTEATITAEILKVGEPATDGVWVWARPTDLANGLSAAFSTAVGAAAIDAVESVVRLRFRDSYTEACMCWAAGAPVDRSRFYVESRADAWTILHVDPEGPKGEVYVWAVPASGAPARPDGVPANAQRYRWMDALESESGVQVVHIEPQSHGGEIYVWAIPNEPQETKPAPSAPIEAADPIAVARTAIMRLAALHAAAIGHAESPAARIIAWPGLVALQALEEEKAYQRGKL